MPSASEIYSGNYLNAKILKNAGLEGKTVEISKVKKGVVGKGDEAQDKIILYFNDIEKCLVLNRTNANKLIKSYGDDYDRWVGKKITLKIKEVEYSGETVDAIRLEIPETV